MVTDQQQLVKKTYSQYEATVIIVEAVAIWVTGLFQLSILPRARSV